MILRVGIVGAEAAKFTALGETTAKQHIREALTPSPRPDNIIVVSGHCHLGGIDIWAEEVADELHIPKDIYPPATLSWDRGYKPRNISIAKNCDVLFNITVDKLPPGFKGMRFSHCYHCDSRDHVKSGGCWTANYAEGLGKPVHRITVRNFA